MANPFTEHPHSVGETYFEHALFACRYGAKMAFGGAAAILHGLFPFLFKTTECGCSVKGLATIQASAVTSFRPTMPATMSAMQPRRSASRDSPNRNMPKRAVPTAPMPVQTA